MTIAGEIIYTLVALMQGDGKKRGHNQEERGSGKGGEVAHLLHCQEQC